MKKILILALTFLMGFSADVINFNTYLVNSMNNSQVEEANISQARIDILNSKVEDDIVDISNTLNESYINNTEISQGTMRIENSRLNRSSFILENEILESDIKNSSIIKQSTLELIDGAEIKDSTFNTKSSIDGVMIDNSLVSQNELSIDSSDVDNLTLNSQHSIYSQIGGVTIINSDIIQGKVSLTNRSSLIDSTIDTSSNIVDSSITNSTVDLCSLYLSDGASLNGSDIKNICGIEDSILDGVNLVEGRVKLTN